MQLLQHFKELTVNPKNAKELKGLILELALRGRLTEKFSINRKKRQTNIVDGHFDIPQNWYWDKFDNICDFQMGKTPPSKEMEYWEGNHPWISIADMETYATITETKKALSEKGLKNYFKNGLVKKGTLIMSFKLTIGKTSILGVDACHNEAIISIYPNDKVIKEYLFLFLPVISHWGVQVNALMGKTLNKGKIQNMNIPLPPLEEQKEIVKVVETLFKEVAQLEQLTVERIGLKEDFVTSSLNQLTTNNANQEWSFLQEQFKSFFNETANIKKLRETVLQLAVQGKLTADWRANNPDTENASILLKRIQKEKTQLVKDKKIKKEKALPKITEDEIPYELPEGWMWCRLGEFTTVKGGKRLPKGERLTTEDTGFIYLRVTDMKKGTVDINNLHYLSPEAHKVIKNYSISKDELYLTIVGATIGKLGSIPDKFDGINLTENAVKINSYSNYKDYIQHMLNTKFIQNQFINKTLQVGVPKLAMHRINKTLFPLASLEEQKAIVEKVNSLMSLCDSLEREVQQSQEQVAQLMQSCLREVFEK